MQLFTNKKLLILAGLFLLILVILVISLIMARPADQNQNGTVTPSPILPTSQTTRPTSVPTPIQIPITFTGQKDDELPADREEEINKAFELRQVVPISGDGFTIDFDYADARFVVELNAPHDASRTAFDEWIEMNGYSAIPEDSFVIDLK